MSDNKKTFKSFKEFAKEYLKELIKEELQQQEFEQLPLADMSSQQLIEWIDSQLESLITDPIKKIGIINAVRL